MELEIVWVVDMFNIFNILKNLAWKNKWIIFISFIKYDK